MTGAARSLSLCWRPRFDPGTGEQFVDLGGGVELSCTTEHIRVAFTTPQMALSSAILNGGLVKATDFLNMRVDADATVSEPPQVSLARCATEVGCAELPVGMMTAASMKSLRVASDDTPLGRLSVVVTTGLQNARRAGDPADFLEQATPPAGTINLAILAAFALPVATLTEMITLATEAKAVVMQELAVTSPVSGAIATGTGTDAIAVFTPALAEQVVYAGKHTPLGESLARLVMLAIRDSITDWPHRDVGESTDA